MNAWAELGLTSSTHGAAALRALWGGGVDVPAATPADTARLEAMAAPERAARAQGFVRVCGVDEAGRGPLAGPLVAGAVCLADVEALVSDPGPLGLLNDSKQLTEARREALFDVLLRGPHALAACVVTAADVDGSGIQAANYGAMARAALALDPPPDYLLVDGYQLPGLAQPCRRLVKGDRRSLSIAAASIVAKVVRDRIMDGLDLNYPAYGFVNHKGYATREHLAALEQHGPCPVHRRSFAPLARPAETGMLFT